MAGGEADQLGVPGEKAENRSAAPIPLCRLRSLSANESLPVGAGGVGSVPGELS